MPLLHISLWELDIDRRQRSSKNYRHVSEVDGKDRESYARSASHLNTSLPMVCRNKTLCCLDRVRHSHPLTHDSTVMSIMDGRSVWAQTKLICKNGDWCLFRYMQANIIIQCGLFSIITWTNLPVSSVWIILLNSINGVFLCIAVTVVLYDVMGISPLTVTSPSLMRTGVDFSDIRWEVNTDFTLIFPLIASCQPGDCQLRRMEWGVTRSHRRRFCKMFSSGIVHFAK